MWWDIARILIAVVAALALYVLCASVIRAFNTEPPPEEPEPSSLEPVDYRYRCIVCGSEVTMTTAPVDEVPEPPRHCREDMALVVDADQP